MTTNNNNTMRTNYGVVDTYDLANAVKETRTDWKELPLLTCACTQRFRQEVRGQGKCRDCHSVNRTGFYRIAAYIVRFENQTERAFDVVIHSNDCYEATDYARNYFGDRLTDYRNRNEVTYLHSDFEGNHTYHVTLG
jgi:hypothetical protein